MEEFGEKLASGIWCYSCAFLEDPHELQDNGTCRSCGCDDIIHTNVVVLEASP